MSVSLLHKVVVHPMFIGIVGCVLLILSRRFEERKFLSINWFPLSLIGMLLIGYLFLAIAVAFTTNVIWLFICFAVLFLTLVSTGQTLLIGIVFVVLNITFFFNHQLISFMFPR